MRLIALVAFIVSTVAAVAGDDLPLPGLASPVVANGDNPLGAPYHTAEANNDSSVSLRDYISSRIDSLRVEILDRMNEEAKHGREVLDERDHQYAQRFEAQQQALASALTAVKESTANALIAVKEGSAQALQAAKEAVAKAEEANNKRFDSVNEFRQTLTDQAAQLVRKSEADVRFSSLDERVQNLQSRIDTSSGTATGAGDLWVLILGVIAAAGVIVSTYLALRPTTRAR